MAEDNPAPDLPRINLSPAHVVRLAPATRAYRMSGGEILTIVGFCAAMAMAIFSTVIVYFLLY